MKKSIIQLSRPVNPTPAGLITSVDEEGRPNIITLGEIFNISIFKPLIMGIAIRPATYSNALIKRTGEFVINLTTAEMVEKVDRCGLVSGRDGFDKFAMAGLTPLKASIVKPPLIAECPVNLECRVLSVQSVGDHDLFLGEVVASHADEEVLDEKGHLDFEKIGLLVYMTGSYWTLGKKLADFGFSHKIKGAH